MKRVRERQSIVHALTHQFQIVFCGELAHFWEQHRANLAPGDLEEHIPGFDEPAAVFHSEAMAHGLPAICSDSNGRKYYIEERETEYVFRSQDSDYIVEKLRRIIRDRDELVRMGEQSYELVESDLGPEIYHDRLLDYSKSSN
ncbi:glycosyltransferase [Salinadaptatus halalkaliphilus]|uniref:Glycosyltransferase n=1 Tax=Salinadaptatus halalkaliphilus TaxID=2419781 RepID=A0A4S3TMH2_9EURY|nr:glycosyltransferase [Salinadaptatus halalkaliphilus]THE65439.1 glycosyltransferase [Salinadaptatus halalkaliphilus]